MKGTHRSTPIAPAPQARAPAKAKERLRALKAPIVVAWTFGDHEHERGELSIGRATGSDIVLDDPLVSRNHARILVARDGAVTVEDLHSANGVFVNGVRIAQNSGPLNEGDRLLIGTTELSLFSGRESATLPIGKRMLGEPRLISVPVPSQTPIARIAPRAKNPALIDTPPGTALTERTTVLSMIGRLAQALVATGRAAEATELVSEHLKKIMLGASAGLPIPEDVLHEAAHHALGLFVRTGAVSWIGYVLEIHLAARRVPNLANLSALGAAVEQAGTALEPGALTYLIESLGTRFDEMTPEERSRFAELGRLAAKRRRS